MNIAQKLKKLRAEKGKTQEQVIKELDLSISSIHNYENVKSPRIPKNEILLKFAKYYNVSTEYLLNDYATNRTADNIIIGNKLKLTDTAIEKIVQVNNNTKNNILNELIEHTDTEDFWNKVDEYVTLNKKSRNQKEQERLEVLEYILTMKFVRVLENL